VDKNVIKVSNFYGRARRIAFLKKIIYIVVGVFLLFLIIFLVTRRTEKVDDNVNFAYLRTYLESKGFHCEMIHRVGGQCVNSNEKNYYSFIRYEDGFEYIINAQGYLLDIRHKASDDKRITFKTTSDAFSGYKNRNYTCSYEGSVIGQLGTCVDEEENVLDVNSYIGVIEQAISDLNNIIDSSGYKKDSLLNDNLWEKKTK